MKYTLTEETRIIKDNAKSHVCHRIKAIKDIGDGLIKNGELGGFVESTKNLSQDGESWIYDDSVVLGNASVTGNAKIYGKSIIFGEVRATTESAVCGSVIGGNIVLRNCDIVQGEKYIEYVEETILKEHETDIFKKICVLAYDLCIEKSIRKKSQTDEKKIKEILSKSVYIDMTFCRFLIFNSLVEMGYDKNLSARMLNRDRTMSVYYTKKYNDEKKYNRYFREIVKKYEEKLLEEGFKYENKNGRIVWNIV